MLWTKSNDFTIDGSPMLGTAEEQELSFSDLDSSDSGRDEAGFMHREVVREKVGTWSFQYPILDKEDYHYLRTLLQGKPSFTLVTWTRTAPAIPQPPIAANTASLSKTAGQERLRTLSSILSNAD